MKDLEISRAHQTLQIGAADMETARNLEHRHQCAHSRGPLVVTDDGVVIYVGEITYPGDACA